ncbi:MAG: glutamine amidotransferase [Lachnospiraceae bacterium]|nr:glutamine amidotransferase [Lachnospiraceae bacterium]
MKLTIGHLYPDLLNLYGDRGNIQCLSRRLQWRGIEAEVRPFFAGERVDFSRLDLVLLGGGSDREQELVCRQLGEIRQDFRSYVEDGGVVLAVCGGYQILGDYYRTAKKEIPGLGILPLYTEWEPGRLVGNIILDSPLSLAPVVGFENHGGRTYIGEGTPFGRVLLGYGNTKTSGNEGMMYRHVIGTYLHGPLLPKNPEICDYLLERALERRFGGVWKLKKLSDKLERWANSSIVGRYCDRGYVWRERVRRRLPF